MAKEQEIVKETPVESGKVQFFGEIDLNRDGKITSDMPAWYFERQIADLEENILRKENQLARGAIIPEQVPMMREEIKEEKVKLKKILESKPVLNSDQRDKCWNAYKSLSEQIKDTMPTRKQSRDGLVDPYSELKRLKTKHIKVNTELAAACGVRPVHGKVSGDEAAKMYQILGRALGENTRVEALRRDGNSEAYQSMHDFTQAILKGAKVKV